MFYLSGNSIARPCRLVFDGNTVSMSCHALHAWYQKYDEKDPSNSSNSYIVLFKLKCLRVGYNFRLIDFSVYNGLSTVVSVVEIDCFQCTVLLQLTGCNFC